jgi:formate hydrogenlyase subunit 6/NADH:ubiquinone oxidoreductase subunit I
MLREFLDPTSPGYFNRERQHPNLRAAIRAYETGEIDGTTRVWFADGKIVTYEEAMKYRGCVACEVCKPFCVISLLSRWTDVLQGGHVRL